MIKLTSLVIFVTLLFVNFSSAIAQQSETENWASTVQNEFRVFPNITYHQANGVELKIDVYQPRNQSGPSPTFVYYHVYI